MQQNRYTPLSWFLDTETGEYIAMISVEGQHVEVDRLPASEPAGGRGSIANEVRGIRQRADAAAENAQNADAKNVGRAVAGDNRPSR